MKRPRISAFPKCYLDDLVAGRMSLFDWIDMSESLGAEGLEMYDAWLPSEPAGLDRVARAIEATGQECPMMCFSPDFTHPDPVYRREQLERQKQAIDMTVALGGTFCRVLSGQRRPDVSRADGIRWVVESINAALEYAAERGVILAMENHFKDGAWNYPEFAQRSDCFFEVIGQIDSPLFGVQYDPSNTVVAGEDPVWFLEQVKDRVVTMHASDRYLSPGSSIEDMRQNDGTLGYPEHLQHGVTGQGFNDYDAIFTILRSVDFCGWISIEDGMNGMDEMRASVDFLKAKIDEFYGTAATE